MDYSKYTKAELVEKISMLEKKSSVGIEDKLKKISHDLGERVKELSCLYKISSILHESEQSFEITFRKILEVIVPSYQYPEITASRLIIDGTEYRTSDYRNTKWRQSCPLKIGKTKVGVIEVVYLKKCPGSNEEPFLKEERHLINSIAQLLSQYIERRRAESELKESREQLKNFAAHLQTIREEERIVISRELHDNLGQSLTALKIDLFRLMKKIPSDGSPECSEIASYTQQMISLVDSIIQSLRTIARELRPQVLDDLGLLAAIEWQIDEFEKRSGVKCRFISNLKTIRVEKFHSIGIFRIVQESLTNVLRHSGATEVIIKITEKGGFTKIEISDNGCGIKNSEINDPKSLGLLGMRERALLFGGGFSIKGNDGKGTRITLTIPQTNYKEHD
ncbi:MAG: sensor histidine kinase [Bacteroidetes bacterium]|nr:sensor histidine kinase [Bacteroidota bacterium]